MILLGNWYNADDIADDQNPKEQNQLLSPTPTTTYQNWIIYRNGGGDQLSGQSGIPAKSFHFC